MQGAWVGFRSAMAEDRFLQARRKSGQRLAFFNNNFGTWEQWELVAGEPKQPWDRLKLGFRNRRLLQVHCSPAPRQACLEPCAQLLTRQGKSATA